MSSIYIYQYLKANKGKYEAMKMYRIYFWYLLFIKLNSKPWHTYMQTERYLDLKKKLIVNLRNTT